MATFTNMATLSYSGGAVNSNVVTGTIAQVLTAEKTAVRDTYAVGEDVTYVVSMVNSGTAALSGLTLTDDLGGYEFEGVTVYPLQYLAGSVRYFVNGILQEAPEVTAGPPLVITGIEIPAGGNALVIYETQVTRFAPPEAGSTIFNRVAITGPCVGEVEAEETVTVREETRLSVTKTLSPEVVTGCGQLTYTFTIQNYGSTPLVATDDAVLTDLFDPILDPIVVTFNGEPWYAPANYTYDPATGLFSTVPGQITVPAATYTRNPDGSWTTNPGVSTLTVTGTL